MIPLASLASLALFLVGAQAGTKIWDGSFNPYNSASDFDKCKLRRCVAFINSFSHMHPSVQGRGPAKSERING